VSSGSPAISMALPQWPLIFALVSAMSLASAATARAQGPEITRTNEHNQDETFVDTNPCNGHEVAGQGHSHIQSVEKSSATGSDVTVKVFENGQLTAATDSTERYQYNFSNSSHFRSSTVDFTFTLQTRKHIIREGRAASTRDSFFLYQNITISTGKPPNRQRVKVDCK
jgi:hypothetical protein